MIIFVSGHIIAIDRGGICRGRRERRLILAFVLLVVVVVVQCFGVDGFPEARRAILVDRGQRLDAQVLELQMFLCSK